MLGNFFRLLLTPQLFFQIDKKTFFSSTSGRKYRPYRINIFAQKRLLRLGSTKISIFPRSTISATDMTKTSFVEGKHLKTLSPRRTISNARPILPAIARQFRRNFWNNAYGPHWAVDGRRDRYTILQFPQSTSN